ncbi:TatD family hydrolase [Thalassomonas actiniarum]|uniref:TatD family hydrolase n=1 Tax=Thalassomonas actiniarum TaxID=485447 RepID=A0AAF0C2G0_9GAMM|nr:TatD family hydrolase [Thalassomonas actiniarum]WDE00072.1 TatD family hydrolase [Thalassomonas actiniarum]
MIFTDSHCHLDFDEFSNHLPALLQACLTSGIHRIIVPSTAPDNWSKVITLCRQGNNGENLAPLLLPCLGIHPWFLSGLTQQHLQQLAALSRQHRQDIIAIGETGIDKVIADKADNLAQQRSFFEYQLQLAKDCHLPVIVHHRRSHHELIPLLKQGKSPYGGIIHAFSGSYQEAKTYIDLGFKLGIGGTISYDRAVKTINTVKRLPLSAIVLETDAPSMPLAGFQGQSNSPLKLVNVFECLKHIRQEPAEIIAERIESNINELFQLP